MENLLQFLPPDIEQRAIVWGTKLLISLLILAGFSIASLILKKIICGLERRADIQRQEVFLLIGGIVRATILVIGLVTALGTLGINVSALVAGLGLTGFALGFAFRDMLSNVLAGVMILMYRPFHRGDHITVIGLEGLVTGIDLRYTTLQNEGKTLLLPNAILLTNAIIVSRPLAATPPVPAGK